MKKSIINIITILLVIWMFSSLIASSLRISGFNGNTAVININGEITEDNPFYANNVNPDDIVTLLDKAEELPNIKAVLLVINSPGGAPVGCEEIVKKVSSMNKTTVALIKDTGASGAYWIASSTDFIVASKASIVGSIGVYASYLEFTGLLDKYGIYYNQLTAGEYKDIGTPYRNMSEEEKKIFNERLKLIDTYFLNDVAGRRNLSQKEKENISSGLFYVGEQALSLHLIDKIGGKKEALEYIEKKIDEKPVSVELKTKKSFFDSLTEMISRQNFLLGYGIGSGLKTNLVYKHQILS